MGVEAGAPGASARREHERRRLAREQRARERWGTIGLGTFGAGLARLNSPQHERAWAIGAQGKDTFAARFKRLLEDPGVVVLHDRRIPVSRANIDHGTIGAGGVTVIDAKHYKGKVRGGLRRPRSEDLLIGGRDQTRLVEGLRREIDLVTAELARAGESVDVRGAVCMVSGDALPLFANLEVDDAAIGSPKRIAKIARRPGSLAPHHVQRVAAAVTRAFPPA